MATTTRYRHAKGCNWTTKHPDYRTMGTNGVPMVFGTGTRLEPCACWQAADRAQREAAELTRQAAELDRAEQAQMIRAITAWHSPRMSRG